LKDRIPLTRRASSIAGERTREGHRNQLGKKKTRAANDVGQPNDETEQAGADSIPTDLVVAWRSTGETSSARAERAPCPTR